MGFLKGSLDVIDVARKKSLDIAIAADVMDNLHATMKKLEQTDVLIGWPETAETHEDSNLTNAQIAFVLDKGTLDKRIPARPILTPAIEQNMDQIVAVQKKILKSALDGNPSAVTDGFKRLASVGVTIVKDWFTDPRNAWAPNAPSTIARKGSDKPLIDTDVLRKAVTSVIRDKNAAG